MVVSHTRVRFINGRALVCTLGTESLFQGCALGHIKKKPKTKHKTPCLSQRVKCFEEVNLGKQVVSNGRTISFHFYSREKN